MSTKYKIRDQQKLYFVSFAVVYWLNVFIINEYKRSLRNIFTAAPEIMQLEKGLLDIQLIQ